MSGLYRFLSLAFFYFLASSTINAQWERINNIKGLPLGWSAMAIDACDSNTAAFIAQYWSGAKQMCKLVQTTDGGKTWALNDAPASATDISIVDKNNIWFSTIDGKIYNTSDGGVNWYRQFYDTSKTNFMNYIKMFDLEKGFAMGDNPKTPEFPTDVEGTPGPAAILRTTDGGENWISINMSPVGGLSGDIWRRVDFPTFYIGYFFESGINPQHLYKTQIGGAKWTKLSGFNSYAQVIKFYNEFIGIVVNNDQVYRTSDGGYNWATSKLPNRNWGNDIEFIPGNPAKLWITNGRMLFFSCDTGKTFTETVILDPGMTARDIVFADKSHGWLYCDPGVVYKGYFPANLTGLPGNELKTASKFQLMQNYPNPFNPSTLISYELARQAHVKLRVYDLLGNEVAALVNEVKSQGTHSVKFNAQGLASGIYLYRLEADGHTQTKKLLLAK